MFFLSKLSLRYLYILLLFVHYIAFYLLLHIQWAERNCYNLINYNQQTKPEACATFKSHTIYFNCSYH